MTKLTARRFGSRYRVTGSPAASGSSSRSFCSVSVAASQRQAASSRAQTPTFASPPLSPLRAPATGRAARGAPGRPASRAALRAPPTGASGRVVAGSEHRHRPAVWQHGDLLYLGPVDVPGREHAVGLGISRRCRQVKAGIARQRQLDRGAGERAPDRFRRPRRGPRTAASRWPAPRCRRRRGRCGQAPTARPAAVRRSAGAGRAPPWPRCPGR